MGYSEENLAVFYDAGEISSFATQAMAWAYQQDIIHGKSSHTLDPKGAATRAEVAALVMNFYMNMK